MHEPRKSVLRIDPGTMARTPLATFTLEGDQVTAEYFDERYRREVTSSGIFLIVEGEARARCLTPADGAAFFHNLERGYANSSFIAVVAGAHPPRTA